MRSSLLSAVATASVAIGSAIPEQKTHVSASVSLSASLSPKICSQAQSILSAHHDGSPVKEWCTEYLHIKPTTVTSTSTYTQPLTQVQGVPTTIYQSTAPPGTATYFPSPLFSNGTSTITETDTAYTFSFKTYTPPAQTVTEKTNCTTTEPILEAAIRTACDCLGVTTPTRTTTVTETTTGGYTQITQTVTYFYDPTTTYPPTASVVETTSTGTVYAYYTTTTITSTSTFVYEQPGPTPTKTVSTCTSTSTVVGPQGYP